jgi:hypothetical protein
MIWSVFLLTPYFFCMFFSICFHLCWLAIIASTIVSHTLTAQPARVCKALRVGNKFVYLRVAGKTPLSFYEVVERDTLVREQRYAVIFSSLDGTRRLERSDEFGLYTFDTLTREEKASFWFVQKLRQNDTLRQLAPFGIGSLSTLYRIDAVQAPEPLFNLGFAYSVPLTPLNASQREPRLRYNLQYAHQLGVIQWSQYSLDSKKSVEMYLTGAIVEGKIYGDTTLIPPVRQEIAAPVARQYNVKEGVALIQKNQSGARSALPNSVQVSYTLPRDGNFVKLLIFNESGTSFIASLSQRHERKGDYTITWDGKNHRGDVAQHGTYLALLLSNDVEIARTFLTK